MTQLEPKPRRDEYCMVCKKAYRDYRTHILQEEHKKAIRQSAFQRHILQLVRKVRKGREAAEESDPSPSKRKPIGKGGSGRGGVK
jgi:queuine/archaeosine tRNA-ribosyltransferase